MFENADYLLPPMNADKARQVARDGEYREVEEFPKFEDLCLSAFIGGHLKWRSGDDTPVPDCLDECY